MKRQLLLQLLVVSACLTIRCWAHEGHQHQASNDPPPTSFNDPKITQDEAHLKEHMKDEVNTNKQMTREEMEFHYFRIHDVNNDTLLDGLEILQAMSHMMPPPELELHEKLGKSQEQIEQMLRERQEGMVKYYEDLIDRVLRDDDVNQDGYLTYTEFVRARRRDEYNVQRMQAQHMQNQQQQQFEQFQQYQAMQQQQQEGQYKPTAPPSPPAGQQQYQQPPPGQQQQYQQPPPGQQQQYQPPPPGQQQQYQPPPPGQQQQYQPPPPGQQQQYKPPPPPAQQPNVRDN